MKRIVFLFALLFALFTLLPWTSGTAISVSDTPRPSATPSAAETFATDARTDAKSREAQYAEAVESIQYALTDPDVLHAAYKTFDSMKGFRDSDGYALLTRALIVIANEGFTDARQKLETLRLSGFDATLTGTGIPSMDALISYCEGRTAEQRGRYCDAYQAYVDSRALDSLSRADTIRSEKADALYKEASDFEEVGDLERAAEVFSILGGYIDSERRLSQIEAKLSAPPENPEKEEQSSGDIMYVVNCISFVSLREWPNTSAPALCKISRLETVEFLDVYDNSFYRVKYQGMEGFVLAYYLSRDPVNVPAPTPAPVVVESIIGREYPLNTPLEVVNCDKNITLRARPSTSAAAITKIPKGAVVTYLNSLDNGFYKVIYHGHTGYALSQYLTVAGFGFQRGDVLTVVNCNEYISLRKKPDPQASRITTIDKGEVVTYLSSASNGFCKVRYNGKTGYVQVSYLSY